jgi:hypothetical protein
MRAADWDPRRKRWRSEKAPCDKPFSRISGLIAQAERYTLQKPPLSGVPSTAQEKNMLLKGFVVGLALALLFLIAFYVAGPGSF